MCQSLLEIECHNLVLEVLLGRYLHVAIPDVAANVSYHSGIVSLTGSQLSDCLLVVLLIFRYIFQTERAKSYAMDQTHANMMLSDSACACSE